LGRYAGIYDEPRQVLESLGVDLVEMEDTRQYALCCGGCAGRLWLETKKGERLSDLRIEQALKTGASILAIACPYCRANFQDSILTQDKGEVIEIKDIVELVEEAI
jgi:Fe-S oxidoreductase